LDPYGTNIVTVKLLLRGYRQAVARFNRAAQTKAPEPALIALFEALNWAVALDQRIGRHWAPDGQSLGRTWHDSPSVLNGKLIEAIRFARNSTHHDWSDVVRLDQGFSFPLQLPLVFFEWRWRDVTELPARARDARQREAYAAHLAGEPARNTLMALLESFTRVQHLLEPPRPRRAG
jgi:hypothetical protein